MKNKKNILVILLLLTFMITALSGCTSVVREPTVEQQESQTVKQNMQEMQREIGAPLIDDFFEKKMAKQIFELRDNSDLITYAYMVNLDGKFIYLGQCIGFGLPYSVQYTNPEILKQGGSHNYGYWATTLPQADPNGLYMPEGLSATWLMLINEETGEPEIIYTEPSIIVTQSKLPKRLVIEWSLTKDY